MRLPSLFTPIRLDAGGDALSRAVALAPGSGAGTLLWVDAPDTASAALVLEPDRPLGPAMLALLVGANALADALSAAAPPELPVTWRWPGTLCVNAGVVGGIRFSAPGDAALDDLPDWLVIAFDLRLRWPEGFITGDHPGETALFEEGFEEMEAGSLTQSWALHMMANMDEWQARGTGRVAEKYLARLTHPAAQLGVKRGIDPNSAALILEHEGARDTWPIR